MTQTEAETDARMVDGRGRTVLANDEQHAAWLAVEEGARPLRPAVFPWSRVLDLRGALTIDPAVYEPGSRL